MAATLVNTLYPPTIATFQDAFVHTDVAKVFFSLSPYNEVTDIRRVHVSVVNQVNNENVLKATTGVLFKTYEFDSTAGMYFITIDPSELKSNGFNTNQFYKVQLRFDCYEDENNEVISYGEKDKTSYLLNYQTYFSEWSSVCLLRPISKPLLSLRKFSTDSTVLPTYTKGIMPVSGQVFFMTTEDEVDNSETETLQSYQIKILDNVKNVLWTSKTFYTGDNVNPNTINARVDLQELDNTERDFYWIQITCTTRNQYTFINEYKFGITQYDSSEEFANFDPTITVTKDDENGYVNVHITNERTILGWKVYIRRSSSLDGFASWEDLYSTRVNGKLDITVKDTTVSSLVWYKYTAQVENSKGNMSVVYPRASSEENNNVVLPEFYDAIISRGSKLFRVWYNYSVSSMKPVVNRSKVDTLGGKYPKFAENAILNYKQFSISGMISAESDVYQEFLKKRNVYTSKGKVNVLRNNYLANKSRANDACGETQEYIESLVRNDVQGYQLDNAEDYPGGNPTYLDTSERFLTTTTNDWMWEREFREELISWLNDGKPKLYRSMAEGSMVVMLTDIQVTPQQQLDRRVWNFSATMYEIEDANSLETLDNLGIYPRTLVEESTDDSLNPGGDVDYNTVITVGQLYHYSPSDEKTNIKTVIDQELKQKYGGINKDKLPFDIYLKNVKIFFETKPHMFIPDSNNNLIYVGDVGNSPYKSDSDMLDRIITGYTFSVQASGSAATTIFVNSNGYYQIPNNLDVVDIRFPQAADTKSPANNEIVTIEYALVYKEKANISTSASSSQVGRTVIGQEFGVFKPDKYVGESIRRKYSYVETGQYFEKMQYWKGICLDVNPMAVANIKYYGDSKFNNYVVGDTGVLHMLKDVPVVDMAFLGIRMKEVDATNRRFLGQYEYVIDSGEYTSTKSIKTPDTNVVYNIDGKLKIYYTDGQWYGFKKLNPELLTGETSKWQNVGLAQVPVSGAINYYGSVIHSIY